MEEPREQKSLQVFSAKSFGAPAMTSGSPVACRVTKARQEEKMPKKRVALWGPQTTF